MTGSGRSPRLGVIGHVCVDVRIEPFTGFPERGRLVECDRISTAVGGAIGNVGRVARALGERAVTVCRVGRDQWGDVIVDDLSQWSDTRFVSRSETTPTSGTIVFVETDGERSFIHARGANAEFSADHIDLVALAELGVRHIHVGYALLLPSLDGRPMANLLASARSLGVTTSLDMTWDSTGKWMESIAPLLPHVDVFCPNDLEAAALTGLDDPAEAAQALIGAGVRSLAAVTCGANGVMVCTRSGEVFHTAAAGRQGPLDTTGAGDCFNAALLIGRLDGLSDREAVRFACDRAADALAARTGMS